MRHWIGTSGFQYPEWKGAFYPEKMLPAKMLDYYAGVFNSTESNYTFRSIPSEKTIQRWVAETPEAFRFSVKAPQRVTHFAKLKDCAGVMDVFFSAVRGLGAKLGPVLFQLPPNFKADAGLLDAFLEEAPRGMKAAFEFRHDSWFTRETEAVLARHNAALCLAESEELVTPRVATADFGSLRLRRDAYPAAQIKDWAKWLRAREAGWTDVFIYFKHEETCAGPGFARALMKALGENGG